MRTHILYPWLCGTSVVIAMGLTGCPIPDAEFEPADSASQEVSCSKDTDCDDRNACTTDTCDPVIFRCVESALDGVPTPIATQNTCVEHVCKMGKDTAIPVGSGVAASTQVAGDCRRVICDGMGNAMEVDDNDDVKVDGLECTLDICKNGQPANPTVPLDTPCGKDFALRCNENGLCLGCNSDASCSDGTISCKAHICSADGTCKSVPMPSGTILPGQAQTNDDCKVWACDGVGNLVEMPDPNDPQDDGNECTSDICNGMVSMHLPVQAGATCNVDNVCNGMGQCLKGLGRTCGANGECATGYCVDDVCCNGGCPTQCMSCNLFGTVGTCTHIPFPKTDDMCNGTKVCNGKGGCGLANGQSCVGGGKSCASGYCKGGKCMSITGQPCDLNIDCESNVCTNGICE